MRILLQALQARLELLLGQMEPELEDQCALVTEHALETLSIVDRLIQTCIADASINTCLEHLAIPVAEEDADAPLGRQLAPEAPLCRPLQLLIGGRHETLYLDATRVHPFVEQLDGFALASPLNAIDQNQHGKTLVLLQLELRFE